MSLPTLRIATRRSPLAIWQAEHVAVLLRQAHPGLETQLVGMSTRGDRMLDVPLAKVGGKGLFVKELELGLMEERVDLAVHSMKDVPMSFPPGLELAVVLEREDPRDAFVSNRYRHPGELPPGACVGTSSLRREAQLRARLPGIRVASVRGNVNTRLAKLDAGDFDAIILAAAGLKRLGLEDRIRCCLEPEESLPAIGQGVMGIECRSGDEATNRWLVALEHADTRDRITAERAMNARLNGGCQVPIAGFSELFNGELHLRGMVARPDGSEVLEGERRGPRRDGARLGIELAEELLAKGAERILADLYSQAEP